MAEQVSQLPDPSGLVESPVRLAAHAGFGRRHEETDQRQR